MLLLLSPGVDGDHPVIGGRFHPIFVEHIDTSTTYASGVVVKVEGIAVGLRLQLISELALGEIVRGELIGIEVEGFVHGDLHSFALLVQELHIPVVGTQGMVLGQEVRLVHVGDRLGPDTYLIARLAVRVVFLRSAAIPCDAVELIGHRGGEADARQDFRQSALRTEMVLDLDRAVVVEMIGVVDRESRQLQSLDIEVECAKRGGTNLHKLADGDSRLVGILGQLHCSRTDAQLVHPLGIEQGGNHVAIALCITTVDAEGIP